MHGHYLLKLTASLAQVRKTPLYSIIFVRKLCTLYLMGITVFLHMATKCCPFVMDDNVLPELFEEFHQSFQCSIFLSKCTSS